VTIGIRHRHNQLRIQNPVNSNTMLPDTSEIERCSLPLHTTGNIVNCTMETSESRIVAWQPPATTIDKMTVG